VSDVDNSNLTFSVTGLPNWANFNSSTGAIIGLPKNEHVGISSSITLTVTDGELTASLPTFSIEVININDTPIAKDDPYTMTKNGSIMLTTLLNNDTDEDNDDVLSISSFNQANHGIIKWIGTQYLSYQPDADFVGIDTFVYEIDDSNGGKAEATVTITINEGKTISAGAGLRIVQGEGAQKLKVGDHDGDGKVDVYYIDELGDLKVFLLSEILPSGERRIVQGESATQLQIGDHDGDGKVDIYYIDGEGQINVFIQ
jgi:hypothetical protein